MRDVACHHRGEERERRDLGLVPPSQGGGGGGIFPTGISVVVLGSFLALLWSQHRDGKYFKGVQRQ